VLAAVSNGDLPQRRLDSWRKLGREAEWIAARNDVRLRQQRARQWRQISAEVRRSGRIRP
jgi:ribosome biogenesis GTPase